MVQRWRRDGGAMVADSCRRWRCDGDMRKTTLRLESWRRGSGRFEMLERDEWLHSSVSCGGQTR